MAEDNKVAGPAAVKPVAKTVVSTDAKVINKAIEEGGEVEDVNLVEEVTVVQTKEPLTPEEIAAQKIADEKKEAEEALEKAKGIAKEEVTELKKEMEQAETPKVPPKVDEKVVITVGPDEPVKTKPKTEKVEEMTDEESKKADEAEQEVLEAAKEKFMLPFKIEDPTEFKERKYIKLLEYGESGVGKTTLAGTAQDVPEMKNCINIDAESGHKVLAYRGDIPRIQIDSYHQFANVYEFFKAYCYHRDQGNTKRLCELEAMARRVDHVEKPHIFNTLILDSLTEIQRYCMYQILGIDMKSRKLDLQPDSPEWSDWGQSYEMIQLLVRCFRDLPMNVILVAGAQRSEVVMFGKKQLVFEPMLPGKLASGVQYFLDHVGYYWTFTAESGEVVRRVYFEPGITYRAKHRFLNLKGNYIENPTMAKIFAMEQF